MTPHYKYIAELRRINEEIAAKKANEEFAKNHKGLKRNMSLLTLSM